MNIYSVMWTVLFSFAIGASVVDAYTEIPTTVELHPGGKIELEANVKAVVSCDVSEPALKPCNVTSNAYDSTFKIQTQSGSSIYVIPADLLTTVRGLKKAGFCGGARPEMPGCRVSGSRFERYFSVTVGGDGTAVEVSTKDYEIVMDGLREAGICGRFTN